MNEKQILKFYDSKRGFCLLMIFFLTAAFFAFGVLGFFMPDKLGIVGMFSEKTTIEGTEEEKVSYIGIADASLELVDSIAKTELTDRFPYFKTGDDIKLTDNIPSYVLAIGMVIYTILFLLMFFNCIGAAFSGRRNYGLYKKHKFGAMALLALLFALGMTVCGFLISGKEISQIMEIKQFVVPAHKGLGAHYGLYLMVGAPILIWFFSCFAYGEKKYVRVRR